MFEPHVTRDSLALAIETLIAVLDAIDGDPDVELNGDELDANHAEDDFVQYYSDSPGCLVSDPDSAVDDQACDPESEDGL